MKASHPWDVKPAQARAIQERLREGVVRRDDFAQVQTVAGLDVGFEEGGKMTRAAVVVLRFPDLAPLERVIAKRPTSFPYVPGLLSFREIPAVLDALADLRTKPDVLLCDGQGYAHPRRFGLACHLGLLSGLPSIGVAKSRLIGEHGSLGEHKGARTWLWHQGEIIGALLRTRARVQPVYVSVGHRIGLETALDYVLACTTRYRLPETTRQAHRLASMSTCDGSMPAGPEVTGRA
jgi:deoxyribonuclease V